MSKTGKPTIEIKSVSITYDNSGIKALDGISLDVEKGSIHGLIGENGAGKTTLLQIMAGLAEFDSGSIYIEGHPLVRGSVKNSLESGICHVPQIETFNDELLLWENIILGRKGGLKANKTRLSTALEFWGIRLPLNEQTVNCKADEIKLAHLAAVLMLDPKILLLDEPAAYTGRKTAGIILDIVRKFCDKGGTVLFISHSIDEVARLCDIVTFLRLGSIEQQFQGEEISIKTLSHALTAGEANISLRKPQATTLESSKGPVLQLTNVYADTNPVKLEGVNFSVPIGAVTCITGTLDEGLTELESVLCGEINPASGSIWFNGSEYTSFSEDLMRKERIGYVPVERLNKAVCSHAGIRENMVLRVYPELGKYGLLSPELVKKYTVKQFDEYGIKGPDHGPLEQLSGGNIQKLVISREVQFSRELLIVCEPGQHLDMAGTMQLYDRLLQSAQQGRAVLLLTSNVEVALWLARHLVIMNKGRVLFEGTPASLEPDIAGKLYAGVGL